MCKFVFLLGYVFKLDQTAFPLRMCQQLSFLQRKEYRLMDIHKERSVFLLV